MVAQVVREGVEIDARQEVIDRLGADLGDELVRVRILKHLVFLRQGVEDVQIFLFGEEVHIIHIFSLTGLDNYVTLIVDDRIQLLGWQAKQVADLVGQRAEIPNVSHGNDELYMSRTLSPHLLFRHLDPATVADDAFVADAFVFSAIAFVVLHRPEDALAEQSVAFGLVRAVINRLGLENLTVGVLQNLLR